VTSAAQHVTQQMDAPPAMIKCSWCQGAIQLFVMFAIWLTRVVLLVLLRLNAANAQMDIFFCLIIRAHLAKN